MILRWPYLLPGLIVCLVASSEARAEWKKYSYPTDRFEVEFSDKVEITPTKTDAETEKRIEHATNYMQDGGSYVYIVGAALLKNDVNFDAGVKGSFGGLKCKTTLLDRPLTFAGGTARELRGEGCNDDTMVVGARYFTTGKWFYQVFYIVPKDGDVKAADRFLQSFKVTSGR